MPDLYDLHTASGDETLLWLKIRVATTIVKSPTDYWTWTFYKRAVPVGTQAAPTVGIVFASFSTSRFSAFASIDTNVYDGRQTGLGLLEGDEVTCVLVKFGSPTAFGTPPAVKMRFQRKTR